MKAVRYHEFGTPSVLKFEEMPEPPLGKGQIHIRVSSAGVNFADTLQRRNSYPMPTQLPRIPGFEVAGVVVKVADDVKSFKTGDRVVATSESGGYSEILAVDATHAFHIPEGISFDQAAALPGQALTVYFIFKDAPLNKGETVLIHAAAGGVGSVAAQIAKLFGVGTVIGSTSSQEKMNRLKGYGYSHAVNSTSPDLAKSVLELTDGKGADVILDSVGGRIFTESLKCLAADGRLVVFGRASGEPTTFDPGVLPGKNQSVAGFSLWKYMSRVDDLKAALDVLFKAVIESKLKLDFEVLPLEQAAQAHERLENRSSTGKLLLHP